MGSILQWALTHPWMTFFIILALISAVENIITSIVDAIEAERYCKSRNISSSNVEAIILDNDGEEIK